MRLICPNCDAQYEIADDLVPAPGREVQCSNCDYAWFQTFQEDGPEAAEEPLPRRELDENAAGILREEANREAEARRREGGEETARRQRGERQTPERPMRAEPARPDHRPDAEEINAGLRAERREDGSLGRWAGEDLYTDTEPRRGRLLPVLALIALVVAVGAVLYAAAPAIGARVPSAEPILSAYMAAAEALGAWIAAAWERSVEAANAAIAYVTGATSGQAAPG